MEGKPNKNKEAFDEAAKRLRKRGHDVYNPAEHDEGDLGREFYLRRDLPKLLSCSAVAVLPGWRDSVGASFEVEVARKVGIKVIDAETGEPVKEESILDEAKRTVYSKRMLEYGEPHLVHATTAKLWATYLNTPISAADVCIMNILQKISRYVHGKRGLTRDTLVDIAGYAENAWLAGEELQT